MKPDSRNLLTTGQAAELCAVTPDTVLKWVKKGRLPASRTAGGHYRIALLDLEPFLAGFGQKGEASKAPPPSTVEALGVISSQDGLESAREDLPCWEYLSHEGEIRHACKQCVVYRVRATRCFLMAGLEADVGHARQFCEGSCEDCVYYRRMQGLSTQVLFISADEGLVSRIEWPDADPVALRFARNGYEASAIVQDFHPEVLIIDLEGLPDQGLGLLDSIAADSRLPHVRVVLVVPSAMLAKMMQRPRHRLVASILEKPTVCDHLAEMVRGSLMEAPVARRENGSIRSGHPATPATGRTN
jgi:excisionase family DNA binding protein